MINYDVSTEHIVHDKLVFLVGYKNGLLRFYCHRFVKNKNRHYSEKFL